MLAAGAGALVAFGMSDGWAAAPQRVASIAWLGAENALALGVTPVGVADAAYYRQRMVSPLLPETVPDLGPFWEPNLERLLALRPDLILVDSWSVVDGAKLERIAPIERVPAYPQGTGGWDFATSTLRRLGGLLTRENVASEVVTEAEQRMASLRQRADTAGGRPAYVGLIARNGRNITLYGGSGLIGGVLERLGLRNAHPGPFSGAGTATVGLDALAREPEAVILCIDLATATGGFARTVAGNALWRSLPSVRQGRVGVLSGFYPFGGLGSALRFAEQAVQTLEAGCRG